MSIALLLSVLVLSGSATATAAPTEAVLIPPSQIVDLTAVGPNGAAVHFTAMVMASYFLPTGYLSPVPLPYLPAGEAYFYIWLQPQDPVANAPFIELNFPGSAATLVTSSGTVASVASDPTFGSIDAKLHFPVPETMTTATLHIAASTVTADEGTTAVPYQLQPTNVPFSAPPPVTVPVPTTTAPGGSTAPTGPVSLPASTGTGSSSSVGIGTGVGAVVLLAAGSTGLVSFRRRRWYKADREGRLLISTSPAAVVGPGLPGAVIVADRGVLVKLLGPLQVEGAKRKVISGPVLEILVFLALHPGETFTSVQLRESIWGLGRQPLAPTTFRKYMVELRKALGPGVVLTNRFHYEMTGVVTCDWDQFQAARKAADLMAGHEEALALVRGPVLHGAFDGKKNSPFAWAFGTANYIEDQVISVAIELAIARLDEGDADRASKATARGLLCAPSDLPLRKVDLEVGAAAGGPKEVGRRLEAAKGALGTFVSDVAELEELARQLGWAEQVQR